MLDLISLKKATEVEKAVLNNCFIDGSKLNWESGTFGSGGTLADNNKRIRSFMPVDAQTTLGLVDNSLYKYVVARYNEQLVLQDYTNFITDDYVISSPGYVQVAISRKDESVISDDDIPSVSAQLKIKHVQINTSLFKEKIIDVSKVDFVRGHNLFDGEYTNYITSDGLIKFYSVGFGAIIRIEAGKSYSISTSGTHNRFAIYVSNSLVPGYRPTPVYSAGHNPPPNQHYVFDNNDGYSFLLITMSYDQPDFDAKLYVKETCGLHLAGEKLLVEKENSIDGSLLKDGSIPLSKLNFVADQFADIYTTAISGETPYLLHTDVYDKYDNLLTEYPNYVSKQILGIDGLGNQIIEYVFKTKDYNDYPGAPRAIDPVIKKPKVLITTGVHGDERSPVIGTFKFLKDLCEDRKNIRFSSLRDTAEIRILPVAVPSAYDSNSRVNHRGVNIARNFSYGWVFQDSNPQDYSGESAASEQETQVMETWFNDHNDCLYYLDYHNTGYTETEVTYLAASKGTSYEKTIKEAYFKFISKISCYWKRNFGLPQNRVLGYTGHFDNIASSQRHANSLGIPSMSLEISWQQAFTSDTVRFGPVTNAMTTEFIGGLLIELLADRIG